MMLAMVSSVTDLTLKAVMGPMEWGGMHEASVQILS
jgi:hypothetical protein